MLLVGIALCLLARPLVKALFQVADSAVGWIPWLGSKVAKDLHVIEQRLTNALGTAVDGLQARVGTVFHSAARVVEEVGQKIEDAYRLLGGVAGVLDLFVPYKVVLALYHALAKAISGLHGITKAQNVAIAHAGRTALDAQRTAHTAKARAQAVPIDVPLPTDLAGLRERVKTLEDELGKLWNRVRGLSPSIIGGIAVGALAVALGRLGLGWARCSNVGKVGRRICGLDQNLLESLLLDTLAIVGTVSLIEFIRDAQAIEAVALDALGGFIREFPRV
jgi:hypothetical protein